MPLGAWHSSHCNASPQTPRHPSASPANIARALLSNLAAALIRHGRIETTLTKARALRPFIEKVITKAKKAAAAAEKKDAIHLRRLALRKVRDEDAITLLFNEKAAQFAKRSGGYTRIYKLAPAPHQRRRRDGA